MKLKQILRFIFGATALGYLLFSALPASAATHAITLVQAKTAIFDEETPAEPADPASDPTAPPAEPEAN